MKKYISLTVVLIVFLVSILVGCSSTTVTETVVKTHTQTQVQTQTQTMTVTPPAITETVIQTDTQTVTVTLPTVTITEMVTTTIPPTTSQELVPTSITFSLVIPGTQMIAETTLQITIMPMDKNGQPLSIEGKLSAELWTTDSSEVLLQQWDNVPITKDSFIDGSGHDVDLEYKDFKPEIGVQYHILIALTVGSTRVTTERVLQVIPPG